MKRQTTRLVLAGALVLLSAALPSCKKGCYLCKKQSEDGSGSYATEICRDDYKGYGAFTKDLKFFEDDGYTCTQQ